MRDVAGRLPHLDDPSLCGGHGKDADGDIRRHRNELRVQARLQRAYHYRKQVLAIFDELVTRERIMRVRTERVH